MCLASQHSRYVHGRQPASRVVQKRLHRLPRADESVDAVPIVWRTESRCRPDDDAVERLNRSLPFRSLRVKVPCVPLSERALTPLA